MFDYVPVEKDESVPSPLVVVRSDDGELIFGQCCVAFSGSGCDVYRARPSACQRFRCKLMEALQHDEIDVDTAHELVARAKALVEAVAATLPADGEDRALPVMRRARRAAAEAAPTEEHLAAEAWLEVHFLGRPHPNAPEV